MRNRQQDGSIWHEGELQVQERAGVREEAHAMQRGILSSMPVPFMFLLNEQRFAVLGSVDAKHQVWASAVSGARGILRAVDPQTILIANGLASGEPFFENVRQNPDVGMLAIDFVRRRRIRLNGEAELGEAGEVLIRTKHVYGNCPQYIQARQPKSEEKPRHKTNGSGMRRSAELTAGEQAWIRAADTFFLASAHPEYGVDASHRGGNPGFVHLADAQTLVFPDYSGNHMFNTLGNISVNPRIGMLFVDFESGSTLQLTGEATIDWAPERAAEFRGAERVVEVHIDEVLEQSDGISVRYDFLEFSPRNPAP